MVEERRRVRIVALVLGLVAGLLLLGIGMLIFTRTAPTPDLRDLFEEGLGLPADAYELEPVRMGRPLRITLRDVSLLDDRGSTVAEVPAMRFVYRPEPAVPGVAMALDDVVLEGPRVLLVEGPGGEWNFERAVRIAVRDEPVDAPGGFLLRNVRIQDGQVVIVRPRPEEPAGLASFGAPASYGGRPVQRQTISGLDAVLPEVRLGGEAAWQVEVARLSARLVEQNIPVRQLAGVFAGTDEGLRLAVRELRTDRSVVTGDGDMRLTEAGPAFSLSVRAQPLHFGDLAWLFPDLPEGQLSADAELEGRPGAATHIALTDLDAEAGGSRVHGRTTIVLQPGAAEPVIRDTDLTLDPLRLELAEQLGLVERMPLLGEFRGRVVTAAPATLEDAVLRVDLEADIFPRDRPDARSRVLAVGALSILGADPWIRFDGLRVDASPLDLRTARALLDDPPDLLRGVLTGGAQLQGTWRDLRLVDGDLVYAVGDAPPTRLADLSGRIRQLDGEWAYELSGEAAPLALSTITELLPGLPLRPAALRGPVSISGVNERMTIVADVRGEAGAVDLRAELVLSDPFRFDVSADVEAFRPALVVARDVPVPAPLTGRIAARGTPADFAFDVDLRQPEGRIVVSGRIAPGADRIAVSGRVEDFRIGALFGEPGLFPSPMSGPIRIVDAEGALYEVDIHLSGPGSLLRVAGWVRATEVPAYSLAGEVLGLDLSRFPWIDGLPRSRIAATFDVDGAGLTPETFAGRFEVDADGSVIAGERVGVARAAVQAGGGVIRIDQLAFAHRDARLEASGAIGVDRPAPEPLRIDLEARDLSNLVAILPIPELDAADVAGSLSLSAVVGGTLDAPRVEAEVSGQRLRYAAWRADQLQATIDLHRLRAGWRGSVATVARGATIPGAGTLRVARVEAEVRDDQIAFAGYGERVDDVDLSLSAVAQVDGTLLQGVMLESMLVRFGDIRWQLAGPAGVRWGDVDGVEVENLVLRRFGDVPGVIEVDGRIPERGEADFRLRLSNVDLADIRALVPEAPEMEGLVNLQAFIRGPVESPRADIQLHVAPLRFGEAFADEVAFDGEIADGFLRGTATAEIAGAQILAAELEMAMDLDLGGLAPTVGIPEEGSITADVVLANLPIDLLAEVAPQLSEGAGYLAGEMSLTGTLDRPEMDGWLVVDQGAVRVEPLGVRFTEIDGRLTLSERRLEIEQLVARSGGLAELEGAVLLEDLERPVFGLTARLDGFRPFDLPDLGRVAASGRLSLTGQAPAPVLGGSVVVEEARFAIPALAEPRVVQIEDVDVGQVGADTIPGMVREPPIPWFGDLRIDGVEVALGDDVWLTAPDARVHLDGEVTVFRERGDLRIFGEMDAERGTYTLRIGPIIREFDIERGRIQFTGTPDINPTLDIAAAHEIRNVTTPGMGSVLRIIVELTGTAQFPELELTSDSRPPLPESELLSFLIFGQPSFQLGMFGGELAERILLQEVLGGIVANQVEQFLLRDLGLPLDYVRVHARPTRITEPLGEAALEAGMQLGSDFFLTTEIGFGAIFEGNAPTWGAGLEWEIDEHWSWRIAYEPLRRDAVRTLLPELDFASHQFSTDIRRRWQYGYPEGDVEPEPIDPAEELPQYPGEPARSGARGFGDERMPGARQR